MFTIRYCGLQACIKELSSEIREIKVELDSLKRKRVERLFNRQDSKKRWIFGCEEHLKKNCSKLKTNRNWQGQQPRCNPVALEFLTMDQEFTNQAECKEEKSIFSLILVQLL
ncbi:hypothetical protein ACJMK2_000807 [Sinanodonta woodiana]|uniref:Uncharacterized protein n=1 Tax=Sinanodonta woodiana TaxID=1069815 RepID=A0ABD3XQJ7_SINWO